MKASNSREMPMKPRGGKRFELGNKMGKGRPKGTKNSDMLKRDFVNAVLSRAHVEPVSHEEATELQRVLIELAKAGDINALKIVFDRIDSYVAISDLPVVNTLSDTKAYRQRILESVAAREMPIAQADALVKLMKQANEIELSEAAKKIDALLANCVPKG